MKKQNLKANITESDVREVVERQKQMLVSQQMKLERFKRTACKEKVEIWSGQIDYLLNYIQLSIEAVETEIELLLETTTKTDYFYNDFSLAVEQKEVVLTTEIELSKATLKKELSELKRLWENAND